MNFHTIYGHQTGNVATTKTLPSQPHDLFALMSRENGKSYKWTSTTPMLVYNWQGADPGGCTRSANLRNHLSTFLTTFLQQSSCTKKILLEESTTASTTFSALKNIFLNVNICPFYKLQYSLSNNKSSCRRKSCLIDTYNVLVDIYVLLKQEYKMDV